MYKLTIKADRTIEGEPEYVMGQVLLSDEQPDFSIISDEDFAIVMNATYFLGKEYPFPFVYKPELKWSYYYLASNLINEYENNRNTDKLKYLAIGAYKALSSLVDVFDESKGQCNIISKGVRKKYQHIQLSPNDELPFNLDFLFRMIQCGNVYGFTFHNFYVTPLVFEDLKPYLEQIEGGEVKVREYLIEVNELLNDLSRYGFNQLSELKQAISIYINGSYTE